MPTLTLANLWFKISRCKESPRVVSPALYLRRSWNTCRRTIVDEEENSPEDWAFRGVIEANILQALLEDEIAITNEDPTKPDNVTEPPPADTETIHRVSQLRAFVWLIRFCFRPFQTVSLVSSSLVPSLKDSSHSLGN